MDGVKHEIEGVDYEIDGENNIYGIAFCSLFKLNQVFCNLLV